MAHDTDQVVDSSENGLAEGLRSPENKTPAASHGYLAVDHSEENAESGLPLAMGSHNTQDGPAAPPASAPNTLEFGFGSPDTQHGDH